MSANALLQHRAAKPALFVAALAPFCWLLAGALLDRLGANPAEALIRGTGEWTLRLLCLTLAVTPLRKLSGFYDLAALALPWPEPVFAEAPEDTTNRFYLLAQRG